jgi:phosphonate transport system substrate-binding protein
MNRHKNIYGKIICRPQQPAARQPGHACGLRTLARTIFLCTLPLLLLFSGGCGQDNEGQGLPSIDLDRKVELPPPASPLEQEGLKVAVAAIISPRGTAESFAPLLIRLEEETGEKVTLVQRRTYQEINQLIVDHQVDVAFICTGAYAASPDRLRMDLLVVPQIKGKTTYQSFIIVPAAAATKNLRDLKGTVFAFTDPLSNTGHLYPLFLLQTLGLTPETFFKRTIFTYSHDRSIHAVASGVADGAGVDNLVYQYATASDPFLKEKTRIIHSSPEFGMPPVVVPRTTPALQQERLRGIFLNMHLSREGAEALASLGIEQFVPPDETMYDNLYCPRP